MKRDVGDDGDDVRAGGEAKLRPLDIKSADRDQRDRANAALPFANPLEALRRERHGLEAREIDRPERDIVRLELERALKFRLVMRADPELYARLADRADVRIDRDRSGRDGPKARPRRSQRANSR